MEVDDATSRSGSELDIEATRKREFLDEMNRAVPWAELVVLVTPFAPEGRPGRRLRGCWLPKPVLNFVCEAWHDHQQHVCRVFVAFEDGRWLRGLGPLITLMRL